MLRKIFHPALIFILLQVAWFGFLSLWIVWFIQNELKIEALGRQVGLKDVGGGWFILVGGSFLMLMILLGITFLFVYQTREARFNRLQRDFISSITHELKSPLASIQLYLETISLRDPPPDDRREFIDLMLKDTERLSGLIDNMLVASRIRYGKVILDLRPVDIYQFIQDFMVQAAEQYGWEPGAVTFNERKGLTVMVDEKYMEIVLNNIVHNAVKYSNKEFRLRVDLAASGRSVKVGFTDQGMGIQRKELKKLFKVFYRSPLTRSSEVRGSGLGLFIVSNVTRALGGKVTASSEGLGRGATFTLTLPRAAVQGKQTA
jgi:hypothetical protein